MISRRFYLSWICVCPLLRNKIACLRAYVCVDYEIRPDVRTGLAVNASVCASCFGRRHATF